MGECRIHPPFEDMNFFMGFLSLLIFLAIVVNADIPPPPPGPKCDNFTAFTQHKILTPLTAAAQCGFLKKVRELLKGGADPNEQVVGKVRFPEDIRRPLIYAVNGPLMRDGPYINTEDVEFEPDQLKIIKELLKAGADIEARDKGYSRETALMMAASNSVPEVVSLLIKNKAKVNAKNRIGMTPLMLAPNNARYGLENAKILLKNGADVNAKDDFNATALHVAKTGHYLSDEEQKELIEILKKRGAITHFDDDFYKKAEQSVNLKVKPEVNRK